jgi:hypothetical protein
LPGLQYVNDEQTDRRQTYITVAVALALAKGAKNHQQLTSLSRGETVKALFISAIDGQPSYLFIVIWRT